MKMFKIHIENERLLPDGSGKHKEIIDCTRNSDTELEVIAYIYKHLVWKNYSFVVSISEVIKED